MNSIEDSHMDSIAMQWDLVLKPFLSLPSFPWPYRILSCLSPFPFVCYLILPSSRGGGVVWCGAVSRLVLYCRVLSYLCRVFSCRVVSCRVVSCRVFSFACRFSNGNPRWRPRNSRRSRRRDCNCPRGCMRRKCSPPLPIPPLPQLRACLS